MLGGLLLLAVVSGERFDDDSYGHYARSTQQVLGVDWATWVTDVWNKPLPGLAFGLGSLLGISGARWVSCLSTAGAAYFTRRLVARWLPVEQANPWFVTLLFFSQLALLKDAFVTMTEIPAAMFVAWALCSLIVDDRPRKAALLAGLVPLCRVEMIPVVAVTGVFCGMAELRRRRAAGAPWPWPVLFTTACTGAPFVLWFVAGIAATGDLHWFGRASYASLRSAWDFPAVLHYNMLTGLVNVLPPPLLLLLLVSMVGWGKRLLGAHRSDALHLMLLLGVHYLLLNVLVVYPKDWFGVPSGHGVAAINGRNYSASAPVLIALLAMGLAHGSRPTLSSSPPALPSTRQARLAGMVAATGVVGLLVYASKGSSNADLGLHLGLLLLGAGLVWWRFGRQRDGRAHEDGPRQLRHSLKWFAIVGFVSAVVIRPFFWYPTPEADHRGRGIIELAARIAQERPPLVLQDTASFLEVAAKENGIDVSRSVTSWVWPGDYEARLSKAPAGSWVVLEQNARGETLPRYSAGILAKVASGELEPAGQFQAAPHHGIWGALDRASARNAAIGWKAFRLRRSERAQ